MAPSYHIAELIIKYHSGIHRHRVETARFTAFGCTSDMALLRDEIFFVYEQNEKVFGLLYRWI